MIFNILSTDTEVIKGYSIANEILLSNELVKKLEDVVKFTYTKASPAHVVRTLTIFQDMFELGQIKPIPVKDYYYESKSVVATTGLKKDPRAIFVNMYMNDHRSVETYIENGAHEFGHLPLGFGHGSNHPPGSWLGKLKGDWDDKNLAVPQTLARLTIQIAKEKGLV